MSPHANELKGYGGPYGYPMQCTIDGRRDLLADFPNTSNICTGLILDSSMANLKVPYHPIISYRPIRPSDLEIVEKMHCDLFPIRYESEFFQNVVNGRDIMSWAAIDRRRPNEKSDEPIGFVTARVVLARESEIEDLLRLDSSSKSDQTLIYILTLGVVESYRNCGIASSLIREVIKYASNIPACRGIYLHVISYNNPAIHLYKKLSFQCLRRLYNYYFINGQHYDSYLFVYYVNGSRSRCSPLELVMLLVSYTKSGFKSMAAKLRKNEETKISKLRKCLPTVQNKTTLSTSDGNWCHHSVNVSVYQMLS